MPVKLADIAVTLDAETAGAASEAETAIAALNGRAWPALAPLARLLLRTESVASSKVEGLQLGVRELARAEARADAGRKVGPTALEILANIDAMELAIEQAAATAAFRPADIIAIHKRLMVASATPRLAGKLRAVQNWIGGNDHNPCGADFVPPPPEHVGRLLGDLCRAVNDARLPPVVQAALVHAQFETIHPFHDGNGRIGRALIHVVLKRRGLAPSYVPPTSVVLAATRSGYIAGLTDFRGDDIAAWIRRFAGAAYTGARLAQEYLDAVQALGERWRGRLSRRAAPREGAAAWAVIDVLPAHPMITGPVAIAATGRARAAVYQAIKQLVDAGVLAPASKSRRGQAWEALGLLELLEGLEAGRSPRVRG
ncbi:MAG: Fic family protein [Gemmatimonadota bacterium]